MPEPQPGADRPVDGNHPDTNRNGEPAVTQEQATPVAGPRVGPDGTRKLPDPFEPTSPTDTSAGPATAIMPSDEQASAAPPTIVEVGPQGTRIMSQPLPDEEPAPPRWSGSAAVPPAPPRRPSWGASAEPTPPPPVAATHQPEHQAPVDPWAGADTSGWELPSTDFPALPPTRSFPTPPPTRPYSKPPAPPVSNTPPPPVFPQPAAPMTPTPPPAYPPPGYPTPQLHQTPHPALPTPVARPAAPVGPPPPPAGGRGTKKSRPDSWQPPGYAPKPTRKRRRWPWMLLLTLACCCGCPTYYGMPMVSQYPATATLPARVADLRLREDPHSAQTARKLETQVRQAHVLSDDTFAGVYTTSIGKRVTIFGGTGFRLTPSADADAEIERLTAEYSLGEAQVVESSVRGRHERCAVGHSEGVGVVVCTSVDHGSIASAVFTGLSVDDSARLLGILREQIISTS